ncbi:hypothetical protein ACLKA7_015565 [Drosophila subpalustris]
MRRGYKQAKVSCTVSFWFIVPTGADDNGGREFTLLRLQTLKLSTENLQGAGTAIIGCPVELQGSGQIMQVNEQPARTPSEGTNGNL